MPRWIHRRAWPRFFCDLPLRRCPLFRRPDAAFVILAAHKPHPQLGDAQVAGSTCTSSCSRGSSARAGAGPCRSRPFCAGAANGTALRRHKRLPAARVRTNRAARCFAPRIARVAFPSARREPISCEPRHHGEGPGPRAVAADSTCRRRGLKLYCLGCTFSPRGGPWYERSTWRSAGCVQEP